MFTEVKLKLHGFHLKLPTFYYNVRDILEQFFAGVVAAVQNRCSQKVRNIHRKTPVLLSLLNDLFKKETPAQVFSCEYCKILELLYKNDVTKNFPNITRIYCYRSPFLSWPIICHFLKIEGLVQVFCSEFCEISPNNFLQNKFEQPKTSN